MSTPILGLPVHGPLHSPEWVRPPGNTDFRVTQDAASHAARILNGKHRAMAIDIGDGDPDRDELLFMHGGIVSEARTDGSANLSIDFLHEGVTWRVVMAHNTLPHPVQRGDVVQEGDIAGHVGDTGAPGQLHCHIQVGYLSGSAWVWVDPEPLFRQNQQEAPMPNFKATGPVIGTFVMPAGGHALISPSDPKIRYPQPAGGTFAVFAALDLRDGSGKPIDIDGHSPPQNGRDQVYLVDAPNFGAAAYALRADGVFTPVPAGHSDDELREAAHGAAVDVQTAAASAASSAAAKYPHP